MTYCLKVIRKVVPGIRIVNEKFLKRCKIKSITSYTATAETRYLGHHECIPQLLFTSWMTPENMKKYEQNDENDNDNDDEDFVSRVRAVRDEYKQRRKKQRAEQARAKRARAKAEPCSTNSTPAMTKTIHQMAGSKSRLKKAKITLNYDNDNKNENMQNDDSDSDNEYHSDDEKFEVEDDEYDIALLGSDDGDINVQSQHQNMNVDDIEDNNDNQIENDNNDNKHDNNDNEDKNDNDTDSEHESDDDVVLEIEQEEEFNYIAARRLHRNLECAVNAADDRESGDDSYGDENDAANIGNGDSGDGSNSSEKKDENGSSGDGGDSSEKKKDDIDETIELQHLLDDMYPILFEKDGKKRKPAFDIPLKILYAIDEVLSDPKEKKKLKQIDIERCEYITSWFSDIVKVLILFVSFHNAEIGLIPLLDFTKSNNGSGRAIQIFSKFFARVREMERVRQAILRLQINKLTSDQVSLVARIMIDKFDSLKIFAGPKCYLNVQSKTGGLKSCDELKCAGHSQCVDHKPQIPNGSVLDKVKKWLPPHLPAFSNDLFLWLKLQPNVFDESDEKNDNELIEKYYWAWILFEKDDIFSTYLAIDDNVNRVDANNVFWIMSYIALSWTIYKLVQKFNTVVIPDFVVPCCTCDPEKGRDYSKIIVKIGSDKLKDLSWKRLDFKNKDELTSYVSQLEKWKLHRTNMSWTDEKVWEMIEKFANDQDAPKCLKYWKNRDRIDSDIGIHNNQNQLWGLLYSLTEVMSTTMTNERTVKVNKQGSNSDYKYKGARDRKQLWQFNSLNSLNPGSMTIYEIRKNGNSTW